MNAKKIVPLVISLISAVLVLFVALKFVSNKSSITGLATKRPQVVVAKMPIAAGSVINEDELVLGDVAIDAPPETVFHNPGELLGRVPSVPLMPGQIITSTTLTAKGTGPGLPSLLPVGMRAITLDINEITGVAGNILAGSHVDIMQTLRDNKTGDTMTRVIAQDVKVASTGMAHDGPGDGGGRSITVFVTPEQAELLELAAMNGRARMALRGYNDNERKDIPPVTVAMLTGNKVGTAKDPLVVNTVSIPATQPSATPTTRPTEDIWTMMVERGGAVMEAKFNLHKQKPLDDTAVQAPTEPITPAPSEK